MNKTENVLDTIAEIKGMFERIHREYIPTIYDNDPGKFKRYINALNHVIKEMERLELKGINIEQNLGSGNDDIEIKKQTIPKYKVRHLIETIRPSEELKKKDIFSQFVGSVCDLFEEKLLN